MQNLKIEIVVCLIPVPVHYKLRCILVVTPSDTFRVTIVRCILVVTPSDTFRVTIVSEGEDNVYR